MPRTKNEKSIEWLIKNYMPFFDNFGMEEQNIRSYYEEWKVEFSTNINDFLWHIFNTLLHENATQSKDLERFYKRNIEIYFEMLYLRRKIEGKAANEIQQCLNRNKLQLQFESSNLELNVIVATTKDCEACKEIYNKEFPIRDVIKSDVIPYENCTRKIGCACVYTFKPIRDENDNLIRKSK